MKKRIAMLLCLMTLLALTGCGALSEVRDEEEKLNIGEKVDVGEEGTDPTDQNEDPQGVTFTFVCVDHKGNRTTTEVATDKATVGEALQEQGLISGEEGPYGLYIKTVNGLTLDYNKDGYYWAFYEGEDYALTGVDETPIKVGTTYMIKAEKA